MTPKKVVVAEEIPASSVERLRSAGLDVEVRLNMSRSELLHAVCDAHAIIVRSATIIDSEVILSAKNLVVVARAGVGVDNIDVEYATKKGIMVVNAPESNIVSAAEHTMGLILSIARNIPQAHADLKKSRWERAAWEGVELSGKTLGILGMGRIGSLVAKRAKAFDMNIVVYDPHISTDAVNTLGASSVSLEGLAAQADIVTIHLPKNKDTLNIVNSNFLSKMKPSAYVVNVSRGGIVNEEDLYDALVKGKVAGAALDVFANEPSLSSPLYELVNVIVTPHLGASTSEAQLRAGNTVSEMVQLALKGDPVPYAVNVDSGDTDDQTKPFLYLAERLGVLFASLFKEIPSSLKVSLTGEIGDRDSTPATRNALKGALTVWSKEPVSIVNCLVMAKDLGVNVQSFSTTDTINKDYTNLVTIASGEHTLSATLFGQNKQARVVYIDEHIVDIPPADNMLIVKNDDRPGAIGRVASILGDASINIDNMAVNSIPKGDALMCIVTSTKVPENLLEAIRALAGIKYVLAV